MAGTRLLLIEDDPDIADMLLAYFGLRKEFEVFHAHDGTEGLQLARSLHPNLILLDVMLPDRSGWDVAMTLRRAALTRYIPIIFLTQLNGRQDRLHGLGLGADDYVSKPFDMEELRLRIQAVLRRAMQARLYEPRTGLPGTPLIEDELRRLSGESGWSQLDVRISGLDAFRETYGFMAADEALGFAARLCLETLNELGTGNDFVGLSDTDTLQIITHTSEPQEIIKALKKGFLLRSRMLYNFRDAERGYIVLSPGTVQERHVPLMHLTITTTSADAYGPQQSVGV